MRLPRLRVQWLPDSTTKEEAPSQAVNTDLLELLRRSREIEGRDYKMNFIYNGGTLSLTLFDAADEHVKKESIRHVYEEGGNQMIHKEIDYD